MFEKWICECSTERGHTKNGFSSLQCDQMMEQKVAQLLLKDAPKVAQLLLKDAPKVAQFLIKDAQKVAAIVSS